MIKPFRSAVALAVLLDVTVVFQAAANDAALQRCVARKAEQDRFSGAIAATDHGRPMVDLALGRLAGDDSGPITRRTRFNLGSASKMFTAVAVGQLVDAGRVRLDDPIGMFVKGLTPEASAVTVRQLLTHSSGLGDFFKPENMAVMMKARTASDLLPLIAGEKPAFAPGSHFAYSNSGFALLGVLVERISGQSYGDYLAEHVFSPAGMADTGLDPKPLATLAVGMTAIAPEMLAAGGPGGGAPAISSQVKPTLRPAPGALEGYGSPAGGLFSTAIDMQRFADAFLNARLTSPSTAAMLTEPQIVSAPATSSKPERRYGFGFGVGSESGRKWFGHNGGTLGANTEFAVFPQDKLTLTVLSNRDPPAASVMFAYLRTLVLDPALCRPDATDNS